MTNSIGFCFDATSTRLNRSVLLFQFQFFFFFLSAVAVDVHLLSLMFSSYAFQRFIYSFINSYLILDFPLDLWSCFLSGCFGGGRVFRVVLCMFVSSLFCVLRSLCVRICRKRLSLLHISSVFVLRCRNGCRVKLRDKRLHLTAKSKENGQIVLHCNIIF